MSLLFSAPQIIWQLSGRYFLLLSTVFRGGLGATIVFIPQKWESLSRVWLLQPIGLHSPWNSPGQNTGVGRLSLLQGIFPNQGSNPGLPRCTRILYQLNHRASPRILEWVANPFSRGSSQPRNRTGVSCIAGVFFTNWATREALFIPQGLCLVHNGLLPQPRWWDPLWVCGHHYAL